jgi:hypothetical protein
MMMMIEMVVTLCCGLDWALKSPVVGTDCTL